MFPVHAALQHQSARRLLLPLLLSLLLFFLCFQWFSMVFKRPAWPFRQAERARRGWLGSVNADLTADHAFDVKISISSC